MKNILTEEEVLDQFGYITQEGDTVNIDEGLIHQAMVEYADQKVIEELQNIRDILDSENSGLSLEQRVRDIKGLIRDFKQ
jgi:uncharacterized protein YaaR (DUF327 family)